MLAVLALATVFATVGDAQSTLDCIAVAVILLALGVCLLATMCNAQAALDCILAAIGLTAIGPVPSPVLSAMSILQRNRRAVFLLAHNLGFLDQSGLFHLHHLILSISKKFQDYANRFFPLFSNQN
jgi:hypothetical protein